VKVTGSFAKKEYLWGFVDQAGRAKLGAYALLFQDLFINIGGLMVGSSWWVIDAAPGVLKLVTEFIGATNASLNDKQFVSIFLSKTIDQALSYLKPGLSEVARQRGTDISREPAFLVGAVSGRIISEVVLFWATKGTKSF
jgi:hypothetical protein